MEIDLPRDDLTKLVVVLERQANGRYVPRFLECDANGAALVSDAALDYIPYSDATYDYYCEAQPGTALATAGWRIVRKHRSTGHWQYADGGAFSNAATDLATVQGAFA